MPKKKDPRLERAGVSGYNKPKRTPNHKTKSHIVVAKEGDKILDTHLGSGSIAIACHNRKFDLDAWEIDEEYYNNAVERLDTHKSQLTMF